MSANIGNWCVLWWDFRDYMYLFNSLAPGGFENIFQNVFFKLISWIDTLSNSCETALRSMPQNPSDDKSTLVQVMAWCRQAASHYLSQCCPRSLSPYGVTRPQWVKGLSHTAFLSRERCQTELIEFFWRVPTTCVLFDYHQTSHISHKHKCFSSHLAVVLAQPIKARSKMKMSLEQRRQVMLQLHLSDQ